MTERVFVPLTSSGLAALVGEGRLDGPFDAHAATPALRAAWPDGDEEEWAWAALTAAAEASRDARVAGDRPRRYVLAADVPAYEPRTDGDLASADDPTAVRVEADVPWKRVASVHCDTGDDADPEDQLAWFAAQEIAFLLD